MSHIDQICEAIGLKEKVQEAAQAPTIAFGNVVYDAGQKGWIVAFFRRRVAVKFGRKRRYYRHEEIEKLLRKGAIREY